MTRKLRAATTLTAVLLLTTVSACATPGTSQPTASTTTTPAPSATSSASGTSNPSTPGSSISQSTPPTGAVATPPSGPGDASLTITLVPQANATAVVSTLECSAGAVSSSKPSTVSNPASACTLVKDHANYFVPRITSKNVACTQNISGPETATITGTVNGTEVNLSYNRKDGCGISAWKAMEPLLGRGGAV
ncbi:hypothetical protein ACQR35_09155 [Pseudarthrobacter sp. J1738]|uniref:hypothetical protein n=1 Tax=unclassified Pseudarthrobacter TaxID=2647000 RepID=UPI003D2C7358